MGHVFDLVLNFYYDHYLQIKLYAIAAVVAAIGTICFIEISGGHVEQ